MRTLNIAPGDFIDAADLTAALNNGAQGVIARWQRITPSAATTSTVGVIRIDGIAVTAGRAYAIRSSDLVPTSTVSGDGIEVNVRSRTGGTAVLTDPVLPGAMVRGAMTGGASSPIMPISAIYVPAATATLSLLMSVSRSSGTGSASIYADATYPIVLWVEDLGIAPVLSGANI